MNYFSSLRFRLQLLVLFAVVPVLGMTLYATIEDRQRQMSHLQAEAARMAKVISVEENQLISGVRELLVALAQLSQARSVDGKTCDAFLAELMQRLSALCQPRMGRCGR